MNNTSIIDINSTEYPVRIKETLGNKAPLNLYTNGNLELLNMLSVGFCGARNVSDRSLEIAEYCSMETAQNNFIVISGNARGVDRTTHIEALKNGGKTIFVIPQGLNTVHFHSSIKKHLTNDNHLIISEFEPHIEWSVNNAMQRNRTIIALSHAMVVIEAAEKGGTYSGGLDALNMNKSLYVINHNNINPQNMGNHKLIEKGAIPLGKNIHTQKANMKKVFDNIQSLKV